MDLIERKKSGNRLVMKSWKESGIHKMTKRVGDLKPGEIFTFAGNSFQKDEGRKDNDQSYLNCHWVLGNKEKEIQPGRRCYFKDDCEVGVDG